MPCIVIMNLVVCCKNVFNFFFLDIIFNLSIICILYVYVFLDFQQ